MDLNLPHLRVSTVNLLTTHLVTLTTGTLSVKVSCYLHCWKHPWILVNKFTCNKRVLLRERKRHTARRVVSTPSVVLTGYLPLS